MPHVALVCGIAGGLGDAVLAINVAQGMLARDGTGSLSISLVLVNVVGGGDVGAVAAFVGRALTTGGGQSGRVNPGPPSTSRPLVTFHPVPAPENHAQHRRILHGAGATRAAEKYH